MPTPLSLDALDELKHPFDDISPDAPGVVAAVAVEGEILWHRSAGATGHDGTPLTTSATFYVASVAKQFTAACVGVLANEDSIDPDDAVAEYLPELPESFADVRVADLVHHLSGLPSLETVATTNGWPVDWWHGLGTWDYVERLCAQSNLADPPGTTYRYSNEGYVLLAALVERVSGKTLGAFAAQRLFQPLGMHRTWYRETPDAPRPEATGHTTDADGAPSPDRTRFHFVGDGGLVSTAADLVRWSQLFHDPYPLGSELPKRIATRGRMRGGSQVHYAWGISSRHHHGLGIHSHGGQFVGYLAKLVRFPGAGPATIVCLANREDLDLDDLARTIADAALANSLDLALPSWAETLPADGRPPSDGRRP